MPAMGAKASTTKSSAVGPPRGGPHPVGTATYHGGAFSQFWLLWAHWVFHGDCEGRLRWWTGVALRGASGPRPRVVSEHACGAPTVSIPTEGDFTQELIKDHLRAGTGPSLPGVVFPRARPAPRAAGPRRARPHAAPWRAGRGARRGWPPGAGGAGAGRPGRPADQGPEADYKRFNRSNVSIRRWSWNYRSCWHQTCPPVGTHHGVWVASIPSPAGRNRRRDCCCSLLPHTVLLYWAICAPAAHLGSGSRLSGSLSGIEPGFSVTRCRHCGPGRHSPELIGQRFVRSSIAVVGPPGVAPGGRDHHCPASAGVPRRGQPESTGEARCHWTGAGLTSGWVRSTACGCELPPRPARRRAAGPGRLAAADPCERVLATRFWRMSHWAPRKAGCRPHSPAEMTADVRSHSQIHCPRPFALRYAWLSP